MLKRFPLLSRFALLVLLVLGAIRLAPTYLTGGEPPRDGMLQLYPPGSSAPVFILRDANGVPHVTARTDEDAFFAIGYSHAQDRLWQLELQRRTIDGRMSELFGKERLRQDVWFRSLNLRAAARSAWPTLGAGARRSIEKYVEGINAGMAAQAELPVEFKLYGIRPQPWTVLDPLARLKLFALETGGGFELDLAREAARQALTTPQLQTLFPYSGLEGAPALALDGGAGALPVAGRRPGRPPPDTPGWPGAIGSGNAWAVDGRHAEGGAALLAADPHPELQMPSPWYTIQASGARLSVAGMSLVGLPLVIFGHNRQVGWGGTSLMADAQDLYYENTDPAGEHFETNGKWLPLRTRTETITVRSDAGGRLFPAPPGAVKVLLRATTNGPLVSDQIGEGGFDRPLSLRWVGLEPGDTSYEALYRLQFAADWQDFRAALAVHVAPALNMLYADTAGNIGSLAAGKVPVRKQGNGALPLPGWDERFAWSGYVAPERLPAVYNPPSGFVVAANQPVGGAVALGQDWASPARADRIAGLLAARLGEGKRLGVADMARIQGDVVDLDAAALAADLVKMRPRSEEQAAALRLLYGWDGSMSAGSAQAVIVTMWAHHLRLRLLADRLPWYWNKPVLSGYLRSLEARMDMRALRQALAQCANVWAPPRGAPPHACEDLLQPALQQALDDIAGISGSRKPADWRWDAFQQGVYRHQAFSQWRPLNVLFDRQAASGGSPNTVNTVSSVFVDKEGFAQRTGASFRQVISLGPDGIADRYSNATGQSGNIASPHYADMVEPFGRQEYHHLAQVGSSAAPAAPNPPLAQVASAGQGSNR